MAEEQNTEEIEWSDPVRNREVNPPEAEEALLNRLIEFSKEQREALHSFRIRGETLWCDMTTLIRPENIRKLPETEILAWRTFLLESGVHVRHGRGISRRNALIQTITADSFQPTDPPEQAPMMQGIRGTREQENDATLTRRKEHQAPQESSNNHSLRQRDDAMSTARSVDFNSSSLQTLQRYYQNRDLYSGGLDEDLIGSLRSYETFAAMARCTDRERAAGMPIMLKGDALQWYAEQGLTNVRSYGEVKRRISEHFTSEEQRNRLLKEWLSISLNNMMLAAKEKSQIEVFRDMVRKLVRIQHQLRKDYQSDIILRDRIMTAIDIPEVVTALRHKTPDSAEECKNRIETFLSSRSGSAEDALLANEANYGLHRRFTGQARKMRPEPRRNTRRHGPRKDGCWVCGGMDHFARDRHSTGEIRRALEARKREHAYVSAESVLSLVRQGEEQGCNEEITDIEEDSCEIQDDDAVHYTMLENQVNRDLVEQSSNMALICCYQQRHCPGIKAMTTALVVREQEDFRGLIIDTGANRSSMMSLRQYRIYCRKFNAPLSLKEVGESKRMNGIAGSAEVVGIARIPVPFPDLNIVLDVDFRIMKEDTPILLCLKDMKSANFHIDIQSNALCYRDQKQQLSLSNDFLVHKWQPEDMKEALFTEHELRILHRSFGHPSVSRLHNILRRARPHEVDSTIRRALEEIARGCKTCATTARKPRHFKVTIGTEELRFNHIVAADVMFLEGCAVLHLVDEATHYQAAVFLGSVTAKETWKAITACWIRMYLGPPDFLHVDQGANFVAQEFRGAAEAEGVQILESPIECPTDMTHVERYHGPLRVVFQRIKKDDPSISDTEALQAAIKVVNDTVNPEGLIPTLLVYGSIPRPMRSTPAESQWKRAKAVSAAREELLSEYAKRKVAFAMRYKGPYGGERKDLEGLKFGDKVLVYRPHKRSHEEYRFVQKEGETVIVQNDKGRKLFRTTVVKPVAVEPQNNDKESTLDNGVFVGTLDDGAGGLPKGKDMDDSRSLEERNWKVSRGVRRFKLLSEGAFRRVLEYFGRGG